MSRADPRLDTEGWLVMDEALTSYIRRLKVEGRKPEVRRYHRKKVEVGPDLTDKIRKDRGLRWLCNTNPAKMDGSPDRSAGDFVFALRCLEVGFLYELLFQRPVGKGQTRVNDRYIAALSDFIKEL